MESRKEDVLIEILQNRLPCSKEMAREALRNHNYNMDAAYHQIKHRIFIEEVVHTRGYNLLSKIKEILSGTNIIHLKVEKDGKTLFSIPVTFSAALMYLYPYLSTLSMYLLLRNEYTVKILKIRSD